MTGMLDTLRVKVAGIPVWVIALLATGGMVWYLKRQKAPATAAADTTGTDTLDTSNLVNPIQYTGTTYITVPGATTGPTPPGATPPATPPTTTPAPSSGGTPPPKTTSITYAVKAGDTLYAIAGKEKVTEAKLYQANRALIEATAKQHGYGSSDNGHWIFPGEKLLIPA